MADPVAHAVVHTLDEAMALVRSGDTIATSGFVGCGTPDALLEGLARRFRETGEPAGLTLYFAAGQGDGGERGLNRLAVPGLLKRVVGGHWGLIPKVAALAVSGDVAAVRQRGLREADARQPAAGRDQDPQAGVAGQARAGR